MESELYGFAARRHEVRPAERGQEVVERGLVCQVDDREAQAPFVMVTVEEVVFADTDVKEVARGDTRGIVVIVLCPRRRDLEQRGTVLSWGACN